MSCKLASCESAGPAKLAQLVEPYNFATRDKKENCQSFTFKERKITEPSQSQS